MIRFFDDDPVLTIPEINKFIDECDTRGYFDTRNNWRDNFNEHFKKLITKKQILTFRENGKLIGICSWAIVDDNSKRWINKIRWQLPVNVSEGDILYIDVTLIKRNGIEILSKIRDYFKERYCHKSAIKEVFWFHAARKRFFRTNLKGEKSCTSSIVG